jgi:TolB-like protein
MRFSRLVARSLTLGTAGILLGVVSIGCGGIRRVAVIPLENLTSDQGAGARASRYFVAELLATEAFDVVEPGEVARVLSAQGSVRFAELTQEQASTIGTQLGAQGLILGSVGESQTVRSGSASASYVTVNVRLVETDTGQTVWSTTHTEGGRGFWSSLFGTGTPSIGEVTRRCVEKCVNTLVR